MPLKPKLRHLVSRSKLKHQLVFEFGSAYTKVVLNGRLVFYEPTVLIWQKKTNEVWLLGKQAYQASDKLSTDLKAVWPMKRKAVADQPYFFAFVKSLLKHLDLNTIFLPWNQLKVKVILPSELSLPQTKIFRTSVKRVLPTAKFVTTESLFLERTQFASGQHFLIDLGQTTTFWVFNAGKLVQLQQYFWGEQELDELIRFQVERQHACQLDRLSLDKIKSQLIDFRFTQGKAGSKRLVVKVRSNQTGLGQTVMLTTKDLQPVALAWQKQLLNLVSDFFGQLDSPVALGLVETGLNLVGGLANLHGLTPSLVEALSCEVSIVSKPDLFTVNLLAKNE